LLTRSAATASTAVRAPSSISAAAVATTRAEVAQAWDKVGPVMPAAPIIPASQGAP
jgi:hypothetical protein